MTEVVSARVLHEVLALLVDRVVGQVHAEVVQVAAKGRYVVLCSEPRQTLFIEKDSKRDHRSDQHIDPQVELQVVQQERLVEIALRYIVLASLVPIEVAGEEDTLALTARLGLDNEGLCLSLIELFPEGLDVGRKEPGLREEVVLFRKVPLHGDEVLSEQVLAGQSIHARIMVGSLIAFHLDEEGWDRGPIDEPDVPVFFLVDAGPKVDFLGHLVDQLILRVGDVDDEGWIVVRLLLLRFRLQRS